MKTKHSIGKIMSRILQHYPQMGGSTAQYAVWKGNKLLKNSETVGRARLKEGDLLDVRIVSSL